MRPERVARALNACRQRSGDLGAEGQSCRMAKFPRKRTVRVQVGNGSSEIELGGGPVRVA